MWKMYIKIEPFMYTDTVYMRSDKGEAFVLRRAGKSYSEISRELGIPKSTLSNWFKGVDFSRAIRDELAKRAAKESGRRLRTLARTRGIALSVLYERAETEARKDMRLFRNLPLFVAGIALYRSAGDLTSRHLVRLHSTDPALVKLFAAFLTELCSLPPEKMALVLHLREGVSERLCKRHWKAQTGIAKFHKTQLLAGRLGRSERNSAAYGRATLVVSHSYLKRKIRVWIDHLPEMVLNTVPKKKK